MSDGENDVSSSTHEELLARTLAIARALRDVASAGDRALLLYEPGIEYIAALLGCFFASTLAVPAYPPDVIRVERWAARTHAILATSTPTVVLASNLVGSNKAALGELIPDLAKVPWVLTEALAPETAPAPTPQLDAAFIQYTSGSTSKPKGVVLTHANLMANARNLAKYFQEGSTMVGWLPPYHDMGLMGQLLEPLYRGSLCVFMSPLHFLQQPDRWLRAMTKYSAVTSVAPNFAFDLCVRKSKETSLDLRSLRTVFNGAEPIRHSTLEAFSRKFAPFGFDARAFVPCYGLAESTLIVTGTPPMRQFSAVSVGRDQLTRGVVASPEAGEKPAELVRCGPAVAELDVRIVDPTTRRFLPERAIGEVWVRGSSVAGGYFGAPEESEATFGAETATGEGPFLRTGDLGFLDGGELCLAGRLKDLVIVNGQNHYPQDIELTIERAHPSVRPGCVAVFPTEDEGKEAAGAALELAADDPNVEHRELRELIQEAVAREHGIRLSHISFAPRGSLPKTSSGKLMRRETASIFGFNKAV